MKSTDLIGLRVVSINTGEELDKVNDVIYDPKKNKVTALLIDKGGLFSDGKVILLDNVKSIGNDAVMVESDDVIKKVSDISDEIKSIAKNDDYLTKTKVITEQGSELGYITDILFDTETGEVRQFELSSGLMDNLKSGKKYFQINDIVTVGKDATIVKSYTEEVVNQQVQDNSAQGLFSNFKDKASGIKDNAKSKTEELSQQGMEKAQDLKDKIQDENNQAKIRDTKENVTNTAKDKFEQVKTTLQDKFHQANEKIQDRRQQDVVGKYLKVNLLSRNDEILAKRGYLITNDLLQKAQNEGILEQVIMNASENPIKDVEEKTTKVTTRPNYI